MIAIALALLSSGAPFGVELVPEAPRPGDLVVVYWRNHDRSVGQAGLEAWGQRSRLFRVGAGRLRGYLAVPRSVTPGPHPLRVVAGATRLVREVRVRPRKVRTSELTVAGRFTRRKSRALRRRLRRERRQLRRIWDRDPTPPVLFGPWRRPVPGHVTAPFGVERVFNGRRRSTHLGLDLEAATGEPVRAVGDGTVVLADDLWRSGKTVVLDHGGGLFTAYFHLSELGLARGAFVRQGARVGAAGATGRVTGPHLHLALVVSLEDDQGRRQGTYVDPSPVFDVPFWGEASGERPH